MTESDIKTILIDRSVVALTLWAEARSQPVEVRIAIGSVIRHRLTNPSAYYATSATWKAVCLAVSPRGVSQFSCWGALNGASNHTMLLQKAEAVISQEPIADVVLEECFFLAESLMAGKFLDRANGATFYCNTSLLNHKPDALGVPGLKVCAVAGALTFLKL